jgi:hypothetical protein
MNFDSILHFSGTMIIINAPSMLSFAWNVIKGFLDAVTKEKINIIGDNLFFVLFGFILIRMLFFSLLQAPTKKSGKQPS